ncbi:MAG: iron-containing redox enzyme family protein [Rhodobacteraceae bacterium]|nr:iron-containing redox enzyme family protein [Paracoccaceae bacterium]
MWREVFNSVIDAEVFLDADNLLELVPRKDSRLIQRLVEDNLKSPDIISEPLNKVSAQLGSVLETVSEPAMRRIAEAGMLVQSAPMAMALGAPLHALSAPSVFEDPTHLQIMALLADDVGAGRPETARADAFRQIAWEYGATQCTGTTQSIAALPKICDAMFEAPSIIFALSRRSDRFDLELIGIDLAMRTVGLLPPFRHLETYDVPSTVNRLDLSVAMQPELFATGITPLSTIQKIARDVWTTDENRKRVATGIELGVTLLREWAKHLVTYVDTILQPRLTMAALLSDKSQEARHYHASYRLEGKRLADWFSEASQDPFPLLDALSRSRLVMPGSPDKSRLTSSLLAPDGAMFRIFAPDEVQVMRTWISSLAETNNESDKSELPKIFSTRIREIQKGDLEIGTQPSSIREAYLVLQGRALPPRTQAFARSYCDTWLEAARDSIDRTDRSLPTAWAPGITREWLLAKHDKQAVDFVENKSDQRPSRSAVIEETLQLAPLTLIDGAWLQGFTDVSLAATRFGAPLFETYWDELGNGSYDLNHPKIYRDVLAAMDITLAPTGSAEFAADPRLRAESFRLPVFWLCLGKLPKTYCPEILGMNLAMELSGVGGTYRKARAYLKHYGFPTVFVDVHNTIDNVSTGHSAWAAEAIDAYMSMTSDFTPISESWLRVRTGYESLSPIVDDQSSLDFFTTDQPLNPNWAGVQEFFHLSYSKGISL